MITSCTIIIDSSYQIIAICYLFCVTCWVLFAIYAKVILQISVVPADLAHIHSYCWTLFLLFLSPCKTKLSQTVRHIHTSTIIQHHTVYSSPTRLGCYKGICFVYNVWYQVPPNLNWRLFFRFWKAFANTVLSMSFFTFLIEELIQ